jgi:hypothetical protein
MEKIDNINRQYMISIDWEKSKTEFDNIDKIEELLNNSLNFTNPFNKLKNCLEAYNILVPLIEKIRDQHYDYSEIKDKEFLEDFNFKRRKLI